MLGGLFWTSRHGVAIDEQLVAQDRNTLPDGGI